VWFEGTISGDRIAGSFHPCGGKILTEPLDMKIINENTVCASSRRVTSPAAQK
jgi:hypothetical protein